MKNDQSAWQRLAAAARTHREQHDETVPYGFAVRVASQAFANPAPSGSSGLLEKFALRGLLAACSLSLAAIAFGFTPGNAEQEDEIASADSVSQILDLLS